MDDVNDDFERDPKQWPSGREHMTDAQRVTLEILSSQTGEHMPSELLTKAEASEKIEELRLKAGVNDDEDDTDTILGDDE
jgi:hypothetical protein